MSDFCNKHGAPVDYILYSCGCRHREEIALDFKMYEAAAITRAMGEANGDVIAAGKLLGISKSTIYRKLIENPYTRENWLNRG